MSGAVSPQLQQQQQQPQHIQQQPQNVMQGHFSMPFVNTGGYITPEVSELLFIMYILYYFVISLFIFVVVVVFSVTTLMGSRLNTTRERDISGKNITCIFHYLSL